MCNRARNLANPETLFGRFGGGWLTAKPADSLFNPANLIPKSRAYVFREVDGSIGLDVMAWDVLRGAGPWPMTNVRNLGIKQWRTLAERSEQRCLIPLTEFCGKTVERHDLGDGQPPIEGEMWFAATDQPIFAVAGLWREHHEGSGFAMVTCDPNELVAPVHPRAMVTILNEADWETWLKGSYDQAIALQRPYPTYKMTMRGPVFPTRVNS